MTVDFKKFQTVAFFALMIVVGYFFFKMLYPYIFSIFWAAVIATLFHPMYRAIYKKIKNDNASAALSVIIVILVVVLPLAAVLGIVVKQAIDTYAQLSEPETIQNFQDTAENFLDMPLVQKVIGEIDIKEKIQSMSATVASSGIHWLQVGSRNTLTAIINVLVMLYALYYFFKDGADWLKRLMHLLPFGDKNERILYEKFSSTSKATLKGTVLLGGIQGTLGGILFFAVGLPSAAFWGLVMVVLSIIPAVGSFIVWFPAVIYLTVTGSFTKAIAVLIGGLAIGILDNLLRPPLVGKDIQMHPMVILFATIGGLSVFGISGVVVGPIIAAFFLAVVQMYEVKYRTDLNKT